MTHPKNRLDAAAANVPAKRVSMARVATFTIIGLQLNVGFVATANG
ncbi:hypothetical protein M2322_004159 [Rhodoblastus acidophilus]|nr:hypothetical protein [Rhodoblastus acidophilus]